jgi:excisionase family DNA binding protein
MSERDEFLTIKETMRMLGLSRPTVHKLIKAGRLRSWRNPLYEKGPVQVNRADVERLRAEIDASRPR